MASKAFLNIQKQGSLLVTEVSCAQGLDENRRSLNAAQQLFEQTLAMSSNPYERAYSCQNLGSVHIKRATVELDACPCWTTIPEKTMGVCKHHLAMSVGFFLKAMAEGERAGVRWKSMDMEASLLQVVKWAKKQSKAVGLPAAIFLRSICEEFKGEQLRSLYKKALRSHAGALAHLELCKSIFRGIMSSSDGQISDDEKKAWIEECLELLQAADQMLPDRSHGRRPQTSLESKIACLRTHIQNAAFLVYLELAKSRLRQAQRDPKDAKPWPQCLHFLNLAESLLPCFKVLPATHHEKISSLRRQVKLHRLKRCLLFT